MDKDLMKRLAALEERSYFEGVALCVLLDGDQWAAIAKGRTLITGSETECMDYLRDRLPEDAAIVVIDV